MRLVALWRLFSHPRVATFTKNKAFQFHVEFSSFTKFKRPESNLITMKLDSPQFRAVFTPEVNMLSELFQKYSYELRIAGGAVRDLLMNKQPEDIDFATVATPEEMKNMFNLEGSIFLN